MVDLLTTASSSGKGRQRQFDFESALSKALMTFMEFGFDGTSMTQLTVAMGIARPSLYATFGNKEALFREAMILYQRKRLDFIGTALANSDLHQAIAHLMRGARTDPAIQKPCSTLTEFALSASPSIANEAFARERNIQRLLTQRIAEARTAGEIKPSVDPAGLAVCLMALADGLALRVRAGGTEEDVAAFAGASEALWHAIRP